MRFLVAAAALVLAAQAAFAQQIYRWVDKDGRVHYTPTRPAPAEAKSVQRKAVTSGGGPSTEMLFATQLAMKSHPVTLYTTPDCGKPCSEGKGYLDGRGVPFKEVNAGSEAGAAELQGLAKSRAVPVLLVGREVINGFEEGAWKGALDAAGYPGWAPKPGAQSSAKPAAAAGPAEKLPVSLYTAGNCGAPCDRARQLLAARGVPYQDIDVDSEEKAEDLKKISGGNTVPTLVIGATVQQGFETTLYNNALDKGGYARPAAAKQ